MVKPSPVPPYFSVRRAIRLLEGIEDQLLLVLRNPIPESVTVKEMTFRA